MSTYVCLSKIGTCCHLLVDLNSQQMAFVWGQLKLNEWCIDVLLSQPLVSYGWGAVCERDLWSSTSNPLHLRNVYLSCGLFQPYFLPNTVQPMCWFVFDPIWVAVIDLNSFGVQLRCTAHRSSLHEAMASMIQSTHAIITGAFVSNLNCS